MAEQITISEAIKNLFKAIAYRFNATRWWKTILWIIWFILAVGFLIAVFESVGEYETRASLMYGIIVIILLGVGAWAAFWKRDSLALKE